MIFIFTTNPSEFASSLNGIGVSYKACTALSLTLRYFPDIARDYHTISLAQQARGLEMTSKEKFSKRARSIAAILTPLILTTVDRIDLVSNAICAGLENIRSVRGMPEGRSPGMIIFPWRSAH